MRLEGGVGEGVSKARVGANGGGAVGSSLTLAWICLCYSATSLPASSAKAIGHGLMLVA